ncbi:aminopeptidase N [Cocleimonas sp. KMM 6892]|uniref:aminopeptidase N n=1 Tax=unclassified Cocleimonas TaxID=2639732 RepID=UPI002DBA6C5B|nr:MULTISPECIES: aminopeptidase N [unclassified Cocleimonas]MEB8433540.1 aminopeptidase N [Cocleimonas sp. KMM 6892]MEC4716351.1 aminopeptidase N [Cocleimonas sp. KMM 6895]MEC4745756.1 aminopeptidase N [Cocleimonas sp. KMM 6896]
MKNAQAQTIYLKDYQQPAFWIDTVDLAFDLFDDHAIVTSKVQYLRNAEATATELELFGAELELQSITLNGYELTDKDYALEDESLILSNLADEFSLEIVTKIYPQDNKSLEGLYQSSGNFCTQCEAQGFRKITYFLDRPDVMGKFVTTIHADKTKYPVMLSNGNLIDSGDLDEGKHFAVWEDPFKKPAYLFALVAGDLEHVTDSYTTTSGKDVKLEIYTEAHNIDKCDHAMQSLKRAMKWDEDRFGLEYDLDIYMVVAVDDFNMGAMENKGLNVFNSKLVFASPETATDNDYTNIEAVIGHEYFHNWTGNRVTCRDWFQLSLKEGLTVFRDQEFTADLHSRAVKRIEDVRSLRTLQFAEDASPMAHPIRPSSFMEINNFYTLTVYEKGAEIVRLYNTLLGQDGFRKGMDLYFERHDGQAVTTEDFLAAMADANDMDLSQMQNWYDQAGTPTVDVTMDYDEEENSCTLNFTQSYTTTPEANAEDKKPYLIPIKIGLIDVSSIKPGKELLSETIQLTKQTQSVRFKGITAKPLPSLLRDFSAPVKLNYDYTTEETIFLMQHDSDQFNRWEASQRLAKTLMMQMLEDKAMGKPIGVEPEVISAYQQVLMDDDLDNALKAEALTLPSENDLAEAMASTEHKADPEAIHEVRELILKTIASSLRIPLENTYGHLINQLSAEEYSPDAVSIGKRRLKNTCLAYISQLNDPAVGALIYQQFSQSLKEGGNMTDTLAALSCLSDMQCPERDQAFADFEAKWEHDTLVMDKWFVMQATSSLPDTLDNVKALMDHKLFDMKNPNKVRSLVGAFANGNPVNFHSADGSGYEFHADRVIELDAFNPQVASRMARALMNWRQYEPGRSELMRAQLERIKAVDGLSGDVYEIVSKSLDS